MTRSRLENTGRHKSMAAAKTKGLNHFSSSGNAIMVDVSGKSVRFRRATATGIIHARRETLKVIKSGRSKKGDVLGVARIAAIQGAKRTSSLIPLCHLLPIDSVEIDFEVKPLKQELRMKAIVSAKQRTGVEMEALTAVTIGLLTVYDMCKAIDRSMTIYQIRLEEKIGGKSGLFRREN